LKDLPDLREPELQAGGPEEVAPSATCRWVWFPYPPPLRLPPLRCGRVFAARPRWRDRLLRYIAEGPSRQALITPPLRVDARTVAGGSHVFAITGQKQ